MSVPLTKGEVRYLGHRPDLEANLYAVRPVDGLPPEPLGRRIAAASEMLDALRRAERVMTDADLDHEPADDEARLTLDAVRAAIAKAEAPS